VNEIWEVGLFPFIMAPLDDVKVKVQAAVTSDQRRAASIEAAVTSLDAGPPISSVRPTSDVEVPFFPSHPKIRLPTAAQSPITLVTLVPGSPPRAMVAVALHARCHSHEHWHTQTPSFNSLARCCSCTHCTLRASVGTRPTASVPSAIAPRRLARCRV
jgi:hypothetical protein